MLKQHLLKKVNALIDQGYDLDDIFHETKEDENLKWNFNETLEVNKSAICKSLKVNVQIALEIPSRRRNIEI